MRGTTIAAALAVGSLLGLAGVAALMFFERQREGAISVRFVSDPPGAVVSSADGRNVFGAAPTVVAYAKPATWESCASFPGVEVRWPDGRQMSVKRLELCPQDGISQEVRIALPKANRQRRVTVPKANPQPPLVALSLGARTVSLPTVDPIDLANVSQEALAAVGNPQPSNPARPARPAADAGVAAVSADAQRHKIMIFGGSGHDTYLGCLDCPASARDSIFNEQGDYGHCAGGDNLFCRGDFAKFSPTGGFNKYSACASGASDPPVIEDQQGTYYGRFSVGGPFGHNDAVCSSLVFTKFNNADLCKIVTTVCSR